MQRFVPASDEARERNVVPRYWFADQWYVRDEWLDLARHPAIVQMLRAHFRIDLQALWEGAGEDALAEQRQRHAIAALRLACAVGDRWMLERNLLTTAVQEDGSWALCVAAALGQVSVVDRLLGTGWVDASAHDHQALFDACRHGHKEVVDYLLARTEVDAGACENFALSQACAYGHEYIVATLLRRGDVDIDAREHGAMCKACGAGRLAVVQRLLAHGSQTQETMVVRGLREASLRGQVAVVEHLLAVDGLSALAVSEALLAASQEGQTAVVNMLLGVEGVDVSYMNGICARVAASEGHADVLELLLAALPHGDMEPALRAECARVAGQKERRRAHEAQRAANNDWDDVVQRDPVEALRAACEAGHYEAMCARLAALYRARPIDVDARP